MSNHIGEIRWLCIQEHNADRAGLHWDLRIENDDVTLESWVIPKHRMPESDEKLLAIHVDVHPWDYRKFEGEIRKGYGKGTVKLIHSEYTEVYKFTKNRIKFFYNEQKYVMYNIGQNKWLIQKT